MDKESGNKRVLCKSQKEIVGKADSNLVSNVVQLAP